jgi:cytochrome c oxidase cbb3-type subunit 3
MTRTTAVTNHQPNSETDVLLHGHDADGIMEYDNPMPFWWSALLWGSIIFSAMYACYYMVGVGPSVIQDYEDDMGAFVQEQTDKLGDLQPTEAVLLELAGTPKMMMAAQGMFKANCVTCHGADGGGGTGPNLRDDAFLNVKKVEDVYAVISAGVVPKGMPAWEKRFGQSQRVLLAAYVAHMRGQQPNGAKAPQGEPIPPWPAAPAPPSPDTSNPSSTGTPAQGVR